MAKTQLPGTQVKDYSIKASDIGNQEIYGATSAGVSRAILAGSISEIDLRDEAVTYDKLSSNVKSMLGGGWAVGSVPPSNPSVGDGWYSLTHNLLFVYSSYWLSTSFMSFRFGTNSSKLSNSYIKSTNGTVSNLANLMLPYDSILTDVTITTRDNESWTLEVEDMNTNNIVYSASMSNVKYKIESGLSILVSQGQRFGIYCNGSKVSYPTVVLYFKVRV